MGKRGPAPKGEYAGQTAVLSTRITPELRKQLEAEVKASGKTISREVEHRLRRSFADDQKIVDMFGTKQTFAVLRMLAAVIERIENVRRPDGKRWNTDWTRDPYLFDQSIRAIVQSLEIIRPEGEVPSGEQALNYGGDTWKWQAAEFLRDVKLSGTALPLTGSKDKKLVARLREDLGDIADRARLPHRLIAAIPEGEVEAWRRHVRETVARRIAERAQKKSEAKKKGTRK